VPLSRARIPSFIFFHFLSSRVVLWSLPSKCLLSSTLKKTFFGQIPKAFRTFAFLQSDPCWRSSIQRHVRVNMILFFSLSSFLGVFFSPLGQGHFRSRLARCSFIMITRVLNSSLDLTILEGLLLTCAQNRISSRWPQRSCPSPMNLL
jgi:hypothetical protein